MATATNTKPTTTIPTFDLSAYEDAAQRVRELNERIIESSRTAGLTGLDAYEKTLTSLVTFETDVAGASQLDWVSALAKTHAAFVQDVSAAYTKAARDLLA
jgi:hypothetical protein